jgi:very-short-patch-repair endonuclease
MPERPQGVRNVSPELRAVARQHRDHLTPAEARLWEAIRNKQLEGLRFRRQHAVETFIFDFYCPACKLVLEVDGSVHDSPDAKEHDAERDVWVQAHGYRVLRIRNEEVFEDLPKVLALIRRAAEDFRSNNDQSPPIIGG